MELPFGGTFAKDTFESGTKAAAHGGTTTIVDFAVQPKGQALREGLDVWMAKAEGNAVLDYGFHMIMSDVNDASLAEMDQLVAEGIPDFKLFTAYPGVFLSPDDHIFRAMQQTRKNGGLILMHAENGPVIDVIAADLVAAGTTDPIGHGLARYPVLEGEATNRVHPPGRGRGRPRLLRPPVVARRAGGRVGRPPPRVDGLRRDLPAVPLPLARRPGQRVRGREVRLQPAAPPEGPPGGPLARAPHGRPAARRDRSLPLRLQGPEGAGPGRLPEDPERPAGRRGPRRPAPPAAASSAGGSRASAGSRSWPRRRPRCSGCTRRRARSPSARTPTSWSTTRTGSGRSAPRPTTWTSTTRSSRASRSRARPTW